MSRNMKQCNDDPELRDLIKNIRIESPGPEFKEKVMDMVRISVQAQSMTSGRPLLGKSFWVFGGFFILIMLLASLTVTENSVPPASFFRNMFVNITWPDILPIQEVMRKIVEAAGKVPMVVTATLLTASVLIFADRLFTFREKQ